MKKIFCLTPLPFYVSFLQDVGNFLIIFVPIFIIYSFWMFYKKFRKKTLTKLSKYFLVLFLVLAVITTGSFVASYFLKGIFQDKNLYNYEAGQEYLPSDRPCF